MKDPSLTVSVVARRLSMTATGFVALLVLVVLVRLDGVGATGALGASMWLGAGSLVVWPSVALWAVWREEQVALLVCVAAFFLVAFAIRGVVGTLPAALGAPLLLLAAFLAIGSESSSENGSGADPL